MYAPREANIESGRAEPPGFTTDAAAIHPAKKKIYESKHTLIKSTFVNDKKKGFIYDQEDTENAGHRDYVFRVDADLLRRGGRSCRRLLHSRRLNVRERGSGILGAHFLIDFFRICQAERT